MLTSALPGIPALHSSMPVLLIGHGSRDDDGRQEFLRFAAAYQHFTPQRPVIPCFLELTAPSIAAGVSRCLEQGWSEVVALPLLLLGARHNKYDVTVELDRLQQLHPNLVLHYGGPLGIRVEILNLLRQRLQQAEQADSIPRSETVVLFVGRGSSDPEANAEACKLARLLWEGSGYASIEVCFIGITHPRLEVGFERALLLQPKRILVLPYFLFTGVLVKKIMAATQARQQAHPQVKFVSLAEMGVEDALMQVLWQREQEASRGGSPDNCHLCKFRLAVSPEHSHHHHGHHHHDHHHHDHGDAATDPLADGSAYHQRIWQVP